MILFLQHIDIEGPGTLGDSAEARGFQARTIRLDNNENLPEDLRGIEAVVVLGGPMNVYENDKYPFLTKEEDFLLRMIKSGIPLLGICLGSQLIAKVSGARVRKAPQKEIGFSTVALTGPGQKAAIFQGLKDTLPVFQWHEDTFDIPEGARRLAGSAACPNQAFRIGQSVFGFQFHVEVTERMIKDWVEAYFKVPDAGADPRGRRMLDEHARTQRRFNEAAEIIFKNFFEIINKQKADKAAATV